MAYVVALVTPAGKVTWSVPPVPIGRLLAGVAARDAVGVDRVGACWLVTGVAGVHVGRRLLWTVAVQGAGAAVVVPHRKGVAGEPRRVGWGVGAGLRGSVIHTDLLQEGDKSLCCCNSIIAIVVIIFGYLSE